MNDAIEQAILRQVNTVLTAVRGVRTEVDELETDTLETHPSVREQLDSIIEGLFDLRVDVRAVALLVGRVSTRVDTIYKAVVKPPTAVFTFTHGGFRVKGVSPMPLSILDSDQGWKVAVGDLKDELGEPVDPSTGAIALAVDGPIVAIVDNGDGTATLGAGTIDPASTVLPASVNLSATFTPNDGGAKFTITDVITVVAGDAVTGDFVYTSPTPAPTS